MRLKTKFRVIGSILLVGACLMVPAGVMAHLYCSGDVDGNFRVNVGDLVAVMVAWGACPDCAADTNADHLVNVVDLVTVIATWGECPGNVAASSRCNDSVLDPNICWEAVGGGLTLEMTQLACVYAEGVFGQMPCSWIDTVGYCTMLPGSALEQNEYYYTPEFNQDTARLRCNPDGSSNIWTPLP